MDMEILATELGKQQGEAIVTLLAVINALRKQPNFDEDSFAKEIKRLSELPSASEYSKRIFLSLVE